MRALILPNDPIKEYIQKGELIERYYNPNNIFSEIHIVTLADSDASPKDAQITAGRANLHIKPIGRISLLKSLFPQLYLKNILRAIRIKDINIIIAHNSNIAGYIAVKIGRKFNIPVLIYMHTHPDKDIRFHIGWRDIKRKLFWLYSSSFLENYTLKYAAKIICAYNFITEYLYSRKVTADKIQVVYHRIDVDRFKNIKSKGDIFNKDVLNILCVGRVFNHKNPENILRAIDNLNLSLTLIGNGAYLGKMKDIAREIGITDRVKFLTSVPNKEIDKYYKAADIFACVNDYGGVSKAVMEAMAASLPIVMNKPLWEKEPEMIREDAILTDGSSNGFKSAFIYLLNNRDKIIESGKSGYDKIKPLAGNIMEDMEEDVLLSVMRKN